MSDLQLTCTSIDCPERTGGKCDADVRIRNSLPMSLRTADGEFDYQIAKLMGNTTPLELVDAIKIFTHWRIINNDFPYGVGYRTSHMLVIKRAGAGAWKDLTAEEKAELDELKETYLYDHYDQIIENCPSRRSVPHLFHLHLVQFHNERSEMTL